MTKLAVDTWFVRLAVETKFARLAVLTKFTRLAVLTSDLKTIVEMYPNVPSPVIVLVRFDCVILVGEFCIC